MTLSPSYKPLQQILREKLLSGLPERHPDIGKVAGLTIGKGPKKRGRYRKQWPATLLAIGVEQFSTPGFFNYMDCLTATVRDETNGLERKFVLLNPAGFEAEDRERFYLSWRAHWAKPGCKAWCEIRDGRVVFTEKVRLIWKPFHRK